MVDAHGVLSPKAAASDAVPSAFAKNSGSPVRALKTP